MNTESGDPVRSRTRFQLPFWRHALWFLVMAVASAIFAVDAFVAALTSPETTRSPALAVIGAAAGLAVSVIALRFAASAVYAGDNIVRVVGPLKTHRFAWREVRCFRLRDWGPLRWGIGTIDLVDGRSYSIWGITRPDPPLPRGKSLAEELIDELNARVELERGRVPQLM